MGSNQHHCWPQSSPSPQSAVPIPSILDSPQSINLQAAPAQLPVQRAPEGKHWSQKARNKAGKTSAFKMDNRSKQHLKVMMKIIIIIVMIIIIKQINTLKTHTYEPSTRSNRVFLFVKEKKKTFYCSYSLLLHPRYMLTYNEQIHIQALRDVRLNKLPSTGTLGIWGFGTLLGHLSCFQPIS